MDFKSLLQNADSVDKTFAKILGYVFYAFYLIGMICGGWLGWHIASASDVSFGSHIVFVLVGAIIGLVGMWVFWLFMRLFG